jgi:alkyl sulfatase BDS1-like metallo-beta-lactamase superfamily hydrolase
MGSPSKQNKKFSVHSMYNMLISNGVVIKEKVRWSGKIPLKIKKFMWYLRKEVMLTKDNWGVGIGTKIRGVFFVHAMKRFNIYSSTIILLISYGERFILPLAWQPRRV